VSREQIYDHLARTQADHVATFQRWVRQPSVSTEPGGGVPEYAELLAERYRDLGCAEVTVVDAGDAWPGVCAFYDAGAELTIASYAYFDTYGVTEADWEYPPYGGVLTSLDGHPQVLVGRGATTKVPLGIWISALEAIAASEGGLPVNVLFLNEGAEMVGSPNFARIAETAGDRLEQVRAFLSPRSSESPGSKDITVNLGYKHMVTFDLECGGATWDRGPQAGTIYGNGKSVVDSPTNRLVKAVATLFDDSGNAIEIDGLTGLDDAARTIPPGEEQLIEGLLAYRSRPWSGFLPTTGGVDRFVRDLDGPELFREYLYGPSINVSELRTSDTSSPVRLTMLLPQAAAASVELRMVSEIDAQDMIDAVRAHLDARGFDDVRLVPYGVWNGHRQPATGPLVNAVTQTLEQYGRSPVVWPIQPFGGPWAHYPQKLGVPAINGAGLGYGARGGGSADEYFVLESDGGVAGLLEAQRFCVDLLFRFVELERAARPGSVAEAAG